MAVDGLRKIARFNWPWYAAAMALIVVGVWLLWSGVLTGWAAVGVAVAMATASFWLLASLAVSHYVYDRSPIARGAWLGSIAPDRIQRVAIFHAGHDEATHAAQTLLPLAEVHAFDFHDPTRNGSPSLQRARARASHPVPSVAAGNLPLDSGTVDLALIVFAAHEMRDPAERASFFREIGRALAPAGRTLIVEHLRDGWNLLAYGPGAFHFLSRRTWLRSFAAAGLTLQREVPCTPFVRVFELGHRA